VRSRVRRPVRPSVNRAIAALAIGLFLGLGMVTTASAATYSQPVNSAAQGSPSASPSPGGQLLPAPVATENSSVQPNRGNSDSIPVTSNGTGLSGWGYLGVGLLLLVSALLTVVAATTLWWMLHAWRTPESLRATAFATKPQPLRHRFSLIVPARHEQAVLGDTLDTLAAVDHPDFEILSVVGHDDPETEAVARAAADRHPGLIRVLVDDSEPKNKPKALNLALQHCSGDVVGVFDAEDEVHRQLLRRVDNRFSETGAQIVQAGVQLMNVQTSWWSMRNCLEYYFWFRSRLHFHAAQRFIPLGGNTVFIETALLREAGGWDAECLAEDCEIGVRLSTRGAQVAVAYDPEVVTREETPGSLTALVKQRTRWDQGFLQVLGKGEWKKLPTWRQRALARYTLAMPFLQAFTGVMIPISLVVMLFAKVPTFLALLTFLPIVPTLITIVVEAAGLGEFARTYGVKLRVRDYVKLIVGTFPYQVLLAFAALRSVYRQVKKDGSWEKTEHANLHRPASTVTRIDLTEPTGAPVAAMTAGSNR